MNVIQSVVTKGPITQMPQVQLSGKGHILLGPGRILKQFGMMIVVVGKVLKYALEYVLYRVGQIGPLPEKILFPRRLVNLQISHSGTILSPIVLLLHQQIQFVESVAPGSIFLLIILQRLQQADQYNAALMLQLLTHNSSALNHSLFTD